MTYPHPDKRQLFAQWQNVLCDYAERHSKILAMAFSLVHPAATAPAFAEQPLQAFLGGFLDHVQGKRLDPAHLAVTSTGGTDQRLSHLVLVLLDGHRTQSGIGHLRQARAIWADTLGLPNAEGLVHPCLSPDGDNGMKLRRDRPDWAGQLDRCSRWGSSLIASHTNPTPGVSP